MITQKKPPVAKQATRPLLSSRGVFIYLEDSVSKPFRDEGWRDCIETGPVALPLFDSLALN